MDNIQTRIDNAKKYVKDHAPQVVTAVATTVTALTVIGLRRELHTARKQDVKGRVNDARLIEQLIAEDRDYTYLPGVGVHVHKKTDIPAI